MKLIDLETALDIRAVLNNISLSSDAFDITLTKERREETRRGGNSASQFTREKRNNNKKQHRTTQKEQLGNS